MAGPSHCPYGPTWHASYGSSTCRIWQVLIFFQPSLTACAFTLVAALLAVLLDGVFKAACAPLGMPTGTTPFCLAALTLLLTHGKIPGLHPIPLDKVSSLFA